MKKIAFSAIQSSKGFPTIGNYLGAIKNWTNMQDDFSCIFSVADLHAITTCKDPKELRENILNTYAVLIACGIDPDKSLLFIQSHVSEHAELAWIMNCYTQFGELSRMTQFKSKTSKLGKDSSNAGLFSYPCLMAADILLYGSCVVPVGDDQKQHVEFTRDIASRFNNLHGDTFVLPEALIKKNGARIMSLQDPLKKMSKTDNNENSKVYIFDDEETIMKKFSRAVTDSEMKVRRGEEKFGINNLMSIYSNLTSKTNDEVEQEFDGKGYKDFKKAVANAVCVELAPVREKFLKISKDKSYLKECYTKNALKAREIAHNILSTVKEKLGFVLR